MERAHEHPIWSAVHALSINPYIQRSLAIQEFARFVEAISAFAKRVETSTVQLVTLDPLLDEIMLQFPDVHWDKVLEPPQTLKGVTMLAFNLAFDLDEILAVPADSDGTDVPVVVHMVKGRLLRKLPDPKSGRN